MLKRFLSTSSKLNNKSVVFLSAVRTPVGSFNKSLAKVSATELGSVAIKGAISKANLKPEQIQEVFMGSVLQANLGQSPARQAALGAGCPVTTEATTINKVCASGLKSITLASALLEAGHRDVMVAGGMESMSNVPFYFPRNHGYGHAQANDGIVRDGLTDAYDKIHMGVCAEETATEHKITREVQDQHCLSSYTKAKNAWEKKVFAEEIVPVTIKSKKGDKVISEDEEYKNIDFAKVPKLNGAFVKGGTVTAANSSSLSDGASALVLSTEDFAKENSLKPVAKILGYADAAVPPKKFTIAPSVAIPLALTKAGVPLKDIALFEINEAFSVVARVNEKILGLDEKKVNINGGAVALGHPIGSSGSRIVVSLIHQLKSGQIGVAAICNGGGAATALVIKKL
ncbi:erg10, acetyl-CoA C-acetyltransferase [Lobulomyces angularis]|nr:erg10, acetyl-CoA C-acetyltransferase [Lobulomyces angularis]